MDTTERLHFHFSLSCNGEGNGNPLQCSCLENPMDGGAWWAAIYGVAQSWIRLKRLSSTEHLNDILHCVFSDSQTAGISVPNPFRSVFSEFLEYCLLFSTKWNKQLSLLFNCSNDSCLMLEWRPLDSQLHVMTSNQTCHLGETQALFPVSCTK